MERQHPATGGSKKLKGPYSGPMVITARLDKDLYAVADMEGCSRREKRSYENIRSVESGDSCEDGLVLSDSDSAK